MKNNKLPKFVSIPKIIDNNNVRFVDFELYFNSKKQIFYIDNNLEIEININYVIFYNNFKKLCLLTDDLLNFIKDKFDLYISTFLNSKNNIIINNEIKKFNNNEYCQFSNQIDEIFYDDKIKWIIIKIMVSKNTICNNIFNLKNIYTMFLKNFVFDQLSSLKQNLIFSIYAVIENFIMIINLINSDNCFYNIDHKQENSLYKISKNTEEEYNELSKKFLNIFEKEKRKEFLNAYEKLSFVRNILIHPNSMYEKEKNILFSYWQVDTLLDENKKELVSEIMVAKVGERIKESNNNIKLNFFENNISFSEVEKINILELSIQILTNIVDWINLNAKINFKK